MQKSFHWIGITNKARYKQMKRYVIFIAILATWLFIGTQTAMALGIDISATVNPNWDNSWNETKLTGTALYTISVDPASEYGASYFEVAFEKDVFASIEEVTVLSPSGWLLDSFDSFFDTDSNFYEFVYNTTTILNKGESVSFLVKYELLSAERYNQSSEFDPNSGLSIWEWSEGGPWQQSVIAKNYLAGQIVEIPLPPFSDYPSGSISTAHAPEPATMLLLGSGLIGLGWFGRKKTKKGSKV